MSIGCDATLELFAEELRQLWRTGIKINDKVYRVAIVNGIFDGRGFEQVTKTQGGGSNAGCNTCDFQGVSFGKSVTYPFYSRYLPINDLRRLKRPLQVPNASLMYNLRHEQENPPVDRTYAEYIADGRAFEANRDKSIKSINGVKGVWAFDVLPYAHKIHKTKVTINLYIVFTLCLHCRYIT